MVRMQDLMKSFADLEKESEEQKNKPAAATPPPPPPPPPPSNSASFSNLEAIKKAIQENLGPKAAKLLSTEQKRAETPKITPTPPPVTPSTPPIVTITQPEAVSATALKEIQSSDDAIASQLYMTLHREFSQVVQDIKDKKPISPQPLEKLIPKIYEAVTKDEYLFLKAIQRKRYGTWLISHSVNVTIFAVKVGIGLKYDRDKLLRLGLAAFLHDVGMTAVPNSIIFKHGKLNSAEFAVVKEHPLHGYELLKHLKNDYPYIVETALQEQEREDGSGYPQGLSGENIREFAKIVGIVDVFEALVHGRAYREGFITYNAIQKIIEQRSKQFNAKYIRALINSVSMYPVGSLVKLSTDEIARVISVNSQRPMRPIVELLTDADGVKLRAPIRINLEEEPLIYIVKPIEEA